MKYSKVWAREPLFIFIRYNGRMAERSKATDLRSVGLTAPHRFESDYSHCYQKSCCRQKLIGTSPSIIFRKLDIMAFPFENNIVYDAKYLREQSPVFFVGCFPNLLKIVEKKQIPEDMYMYASYSKSNGYLLLPYDSGYKRKRLLILAQWVEEHVPGFIKDTQDKSPSTTLLQNLPPLPEMALLPLHIQLRMPFLSVEPITIRTTKPGVFTTETLVFCLKDVERILGAPKHVNVLATTIHGCLKEGAQHDFVKFANDKHMGNAQCHALCHLYLTFQGFVKMLFFYSSNPFAERAQQELVRLILPTKSFNYTAYLLQSLDERDTCVVGLTTDLDTAMHTMENFKIKKCMNIHPMHLESVSAYLNEKFPLLNKPFKVSNGKFKYYVLCFQELKEFYCNE